MEDLFKGVRIYILPVKIEPYTVEATKKLLEKHGNLFTSNSCKICARNINAGVQVENTVHLKTRRQ